MKTLITPLVVFLFATVSYSQSASIDISPTEVATIELNSATENSIKTTPNALMLKKKFSFEHSKKAVNQLHLFLAKNVSFPSVMSENLKDGKTVLEIDLNSNKTIKSAKVFKSVSTAFDKAALDAVKLIKKIDLEEDVYYGNTKIYVPVTFTLSDF